MLSLLLTNLNRAEKLNLKTVFDKSVQHIIFLVTTSLCESSTQKYSWNVFEADTKKSISSHIFDPDIEVSFILTCRRIILELLDAFLQKLLQVSLLAPLGEGLLHPHDVAVPGLERVRARIRSQRSFKFPKNDFKRLEQMLVKELGSNFERSLWSKICESIRLVNCDTRKCYLLIFPQNLFQSS